MGYKFDLTLRYLEDPCVLRPKLSETLINVWRQIGKERRGLKTHQGRLNHHKFIQITHYLAVLL
jgi:hypothetical protein